MSLQAQQQHEQDDMSGPPGEPSSYTPVPQTQFYDTQQQVSSGHAYPQTQQHMANAGSLPSGPQEGDAPSTHVFFQSWEPPPPITPAPSDPELLKRIDKLVEYAAKNGPQFEALMKEKQKDNPAYAFLLGGEGYDYYRYSLWTAVTPLSADGEVAAPATEGNPSDGAYQEPYFDPQKGQHYPQQNDMQQQQHMQQQHHDNYQYPPQGTHAPFFPHFPPHPSHLHQQQPPHGIAYDAYGNPIGPPMGPSMGLPGVDPYGYPPQPRPGFPMNIGMPPGGVGPMGEPFGGGGGGGSRALPPEVASEMQEVLGTLTGTKEVIKSAKAWFMQRVSFAPLLVEGIKAQVKALSGEPERQLHVVFLINDILFNSLQHRPIPSELDPVTLAFQPHLGAILALAYHGPHTTEAGQGRLAKIIEFWGTKEVFGRDVINQLEGEMMAGPPIQELGPPNGPGAPFFPNSWQGPDSQQIEQQQHLMMQQHPPPHLHPLGPPQGMGDPLNNFFPPHPFNNMPPGGPPNMFAPNPSLPFPSANMQPPPGADGGHPQSFHSEQHEAARLPPSGDEPPPYPLFPPGLIPGMVRKMQIGSGVPYSQISPADIPTQIPPQTVSDSYIKKRIRKYFKEIGEPDPLADPDDEEEEEEEEKSRYSHHIGGVGSRRGGRDRDRGERDFGKGGGRDRDASGLGLGLGEGMGLGMGGGGLGLGLAPPIMEVDPETGTLPDGSVAERKGPGGQKLGERAGLGAHSANDEEEEESVLTQYGDLYSSYRKSRSSNYHTSLSVRAANRYEQTQGGA
eukprot:TRINITY_DN413_c5_g1_i1.p1 TRINITY_DN413_c5_g1~~TRINITY_DN413_c5_g1_i1.p1  ORF type:complete len:787 (-),score=157.24 TRINITY_DN413_c5_g1_i1:325-2685(-)